MALGAPGKMRKKELPFPPTGRIDVGLTQAFLTTPNEWRIRAKPLSSRIQRARGQRWTQSRGRQFGMAPCLPPGAPPCTPQPSGAEHWSPGRGARRRAAASSAGEQLADLRL